jgi:hypothetical protein
VNIPTIGIREGSFRNRLTPGRFGSDVWDSVENGYTPPKSRTKIATAKRLHKINTTTRNAILSSL